MPRLEYLAFSQIDPADFLPMLNKQTTRQHLIDHELFTPDTAKAWVQSKIDVDACQGCRVRAIKVDNQLAGWCGIQLEEGQYEIAVVIEDIYWGLGRPIFREMMGWAKELGHTTVFIHFLHTRPQYKFLRKMSKNVYVSELMGSTFTTYELEVR